MPIVTLNHRHWVRRYYRRVEGKFVADLDQISGTLYVTSIDYTLDIDALYRKARVWESAGPGRCNRTDWDDALCAP